MLRRAVWLVGLSGAMFISVAPVEASCDIRLKLYKAAKADCEASGRYCDDVVLYKQDAVKECGPGAVPDDDPDGSGGSSDDGGLTSLNKEAPDLSKGLPRSCAYLTKPSYEDVRLNYHMPGAMVCHAGKAYECQSTGDVKDWVYRAPCEVFQGIAEACDVEGTC